MEGAQIGAEFGSLLGECDLMLTYDRSINAIRKSEPRIQPNPWVLGREILFNEQLQYEPRHLDPVQGN